MIKDFAAEVVRRIEEDVALKTSFLASGSCKSFEDYRDTCGQIRGLKFARQHIEDTLKNVEEDDA